MGRGGGRKGGGNVEVAVLLDEGAHLLDLREFLDGLVVGESNEEGGDAVDEITGKRTVESQR
jgi:hypothetical protein